MMSLLAKVTTAAPSFPSRVVLYAAKKWGKCGRPAAGEREVSTC
jgi:hypothetical protein